MSYRMSPDEPRPNAFAIAFRNVVDRVYGTPDRLENTSQELKDFMLSPDRLREASEVASVVTGLVDAELAPDGKRSVGQHGPSMAKPLGVLLRKKLKSPEQIEAAAAAIREAVAVAYAMTAEQEQLGASFKYVGAAPQDIWNIVVTGYRTNGLQEIGFDRAFQSAVEEQSSAVLTGLLAEAGLLGSRVGKVRYSGYHYGSAGSLARLAQSDLAFPEKTLVVAALLGPQSGSPAL